MQIGNSPIDRNVVVTHLASGVSISTARYAKNTRKLTNKVISYGNLVTASSGTPRIRVITACPSTAERSVDNKVLVLDIGRKIAPEGRPKSDGSSPGRWIGLTVLDVLRDRVAYKVPHLEPRAVP
jgi:hypothetical protein